MTNKIEGIRSAREMAEQVNYFEPVKKRQTMNQVATEMLGVLNNLDLNNGDEREVFDEELGCGVRIKLEVFTPEYQSDTSCKTYVVSSYNMFDKRGTVFAKIVEGYGINLYSFEMGIEDNPDNIINLQSIVDCFRDTGSKKR